MCVCVCVCVCVRVCTCVHTCEAVICNDDECIFVSFPVGMRAAYDRTEQLMKFGQMVAFFEIFHAVIGMVKSNVFSTVIQVRMGRECVVCEEKVCIVWEGV